MTSLTNRAARAMLAYERWLERRPPDHGATYPGETAERLIERQASTTREWCRVAAEAVRRGMTATARRNAGQRARAEGRGGRA